MSKFAAIIRKFPEQELPIHKLCGQDDDFLAVCADYEEATQALHHWTTAGPEYATRVEEYHQLMGDLQLEVLEALQALQSRPAPPDK